VVIRSTIGCIALVRWLVKHGLASDDDVDPGPLGPGADLRPQPPVLPGVLADLGVEEDLPEQVVPGDGPGGDAAGEFHPDHVAGIAQQGGLTRKVGARGIEDEGQLAHHGDAPEAGVNKGAFPRLSELTPR
jgi:hypothetical protein